MDVDVDVDVNVDVDVDVDVAVAVAVDVDVDVDSTCEQMFGGRSTQLRVFGRGCGYRGAGGLSNTIHTQVLVAASGSAACGSAVRV